MVTMVMVATQITMTVVQFPVLGVFKFITDSSGTSKNCEIMVPKCGKLM